MKTNTPKNHMKITFASRPTCKWPRPPAALLLLLLATLACNLPLAPTQTARAVPSSVTAAPLNPFAQDAPPTQNPPFAVNHAAVNVPASLALSLADLPFQVDCSALDPSRQPECDTYLANTRTIVYPFYRQLTGDSLSDCYDAVYYRIVPDEALTDRQGEASDNHITYNLRSTLDLNSAPLYDSHEILHVIGFCNGALDHHVFHGALEAHVDLTLTGARWQSPDRDHIVQWLETELIPGLAQLDSEGIVTATPAPNQGTGGADLFDACNEIFNRFVNVLYYDAGIETIQRVYRDTINPAPEIAPNPTLARIYGDTLGRQFQVVVNALKQNPAHQTRVPQCGIE